MRNILVSLALLCALSLLRASTATAAITIATVPVGNPGNAALDLNFGGHFHTIGSVSYSYSIGEIGRAHV